MATTLKVMVRNTKCIENFQAVSIIEILQQRILVNKCEVISENRAHMRLNKIYCNASHFKMNNGRMSEWHTLKGLYTLPKDKLILFFDFKKKYSKGA